LFEKGISVIPDILANAGGVVVSYFEWDQNLKGESWTEEEVNSKLQPIMAAASKNVIDSAKEFKTDLRMGAFIAAIERISANI
jgi:glutamate dehydrogenase/leucine dehydrogenase